MEFFRFPRTPHLTWLGQGAPRDDKLLTPAEASELLTHDLVIEEKVDGANVGISIDEKDEVRAQNRGAYVAREERHPQFKPLFGWMAAHRSVFRAVLSPNWLLFGEWCYAVHHARYTELPDWFLAFDVYDRRARQFFCTTRRDEVVTALGLSPVPQLAVGRFDLEGVRSLMGSSRLGDGPAEGLYLRRDDRKWLGARAKLVRPEFVQSIGEHWTRRSIEENALERGRQALRRRATES